MSCSFGPLDERCINAIRCFSAAMPQLAKSGHPGAPMGCAPIAHVLYSRVRRVSPNAPDWIGRDRFVLSNGHACALQYAMLHLLGYPRMTLHEISRFRQLNSCTPGHPECFQTEGVDVTSGPLGQGIAQAVGLAIAGESLSALYDKPDENLRPFGDSFVYALVGDGCLQEGVASEACSLAGHLGLGRLIVFYDQNHISIDGNTDLSFTEDVCGRFRSYGWSVLEVPDADSNLDGLLAAVYWARADLTRPTLIACRTTIGFGSSLAGSEKVHGAPLPELELQALRAKWGIEPVDDILSVPDDVQAVYREAAVTGHSHFIAWNEMMNRYAASHPEKFAELASRIARNDLPADLEQRLPRFGKDCKPESTRVLSGIVLNAVDTLLQRSLVGGSADLTGSNCSLLKATSNFSRSNRAGRYIRFGVREHAMAAICNGIFAYGVLRPFAATFLNFVTYAWGALRLAALSHFGVLFIATHDSIELGEDGPTHQPIEVAALCRATPNLNYFRPADGNEVSAGYALWLRNPTRPTVLALCRGAVPSLAGSSIEKALRGGYILKDFDESNAGAVRPRLIVGSCGSELSVALAAAESLKDEFDIRVLSIPCWSLLLGQEPSYITSLFSSTSSDVQRPPECVRDPPSENHLVTWRSMRRQIPSLYVEAAATLGAETLFTATFGMSRFGASAPKKDLAQYFGFTPESVAAELRNLARLEQVSSVTV